MAWGSRRRRANATSALWTALAPMLPVWHLRGRDRRAQPADASLAELVDAHFREYSTPAHPNRDSLTVALALLGERPARILETGSSAWGTNSSRLFDRYVRRFGGSFLTIDIRPGPAWRLRAALSPASEMLVGDSIRALTSLAARPIAPFDLVYLDSFDLDTAAPLPSMLHGLAEFLLLQPFVKPGTLILIDDTPASIRDWTRVAGTPLTPVRSLAGDLLPGKGALVLRLFDPATFEIVRHGYQVLLRKTR